ncbi:WXG100 family type VII secretion target [Microbacterium sp. GXS0129]|uniref:WXG100 family type VII secretion target n=1 Tax=Microbacterium sp. GXS0129 TaxID=3377836 RepID=UPI00383AD754
MQISVKHDGVAGLVAEMTVTSRQIAHELEQLDRTAALLQSQWNGEALEAYRVAHARWSAAQAVMSTVLRELTKRLANANQISIDTGALAARVWD